MENQLVVFSLANEDYGVDIGTVDGIVKMQAITAVPHAPGFVAAPWVRGITNLRGEVLPVIDLRQRFGLAQAEATVSGAADTRIVNVDVNGVRVGMVVDAVTEVLRVAEEEVEPPSPLVTTVNSAFITGIAKVDSRLIILLDLAKVLNTEEQAELKTLQRVQDSPATGKV